MRYAPFGASSAWLETIRPAFVDEAMFYLGLRCNEGIVSLRVARLFYVAHVYARARMHASTQPSVQLLHWHSGDGNI